MNHGRRSTASAFFNSLLDASTLCLRTNCHEGNLRVDGPSASRLGAGAVCRFAIGAPPSLESTGQKVWEKCALRQSSTFCERISPASSQGSAALRTFVSQRSLPLNMPKRKQSPTKGKVKLGKRIMALAEKQRAEQAARCKELELLFRGQAPKSSTLR